MAAHDTTPREMHVTPEHRRDAIGHGTPRPVERRWPRRRLALLAALWLVCALALALLAMAAHTAATFTVDPPVAQWVQQWSGTPLALVIELGSAANWPLPAAVILAVIFGVLLWRRLFPEAICTAAASFGADLVNVALNGIVDRPRPHNLHLATPLGLGSHSFPSGHAAHTLALYGFLWYLSRRTSTVAPAWRPWLRVVEGICVYFILTVGLSRVLEHGHWPSDVLAGYLVGMLSLLAAIALYHVLALRRQTARGTKPEPGASQ